MKKFKKAIIPCALAAVLLLLAPSCSKPSNADTDLDLKLALLESRLAAIQESNAALEEKQRAERVAMESKLEELKELIESAAATPETETPAEDEKYFGFSYITEEGGAIITSYDGDSKDIIIPASIRTLPVIAIADEAFKGSSAVSVSIPETVERIGWFAFASCPRLERIVIPQKVSEIGYGAFDGSPLVTVYASPDSYAAKYAKSYGVTVVSD